MNPVIMKCGCAANATCSRMGEREYNPPIPSCVIHDCIEVADEQPDFTGRMARCAYFKTCKHIQPSDPEKLAFFEYRGPGSPESRDICKCGFHVKAHVKEDFKCKDFVARGPNEFDMYYCGCRGWD